MGNINENRNNDSNRRQGARTISFLVLIILFFAALFLIAVWPNLDESSTVIKKVSGEMRLILLVIAGGVFGSALRSYSSLLRIVRDKQKVEFPAIYMWRIFLGIPPPLIIYIIIRGIIISPNAAISSINSIGILFVSVLFGFFSVEFVDKMHLIFKPFLDKETILENKIEHISSALGIDLLDNYKGFLCYDIMASNWESETKSEQGYILLPGHSYSLIVFFQLWKPDTNNCERIEIIGGNDSKEVRFTITPRFDTISLQPREQTALFGIEERSEKLSFNFTIPYEQTPSDFWIEILQKNRLVISVSPKLIYSANLK